MVVVPLLLQISHIFSCNFSSSMLPACAPRQRPNNDVYESFHPAVCGVNHTVDPVQQDSLTAQLAITVWHWLLTSLIPSAKLH